MPRKKLVRNSPKELSVVSARKSTRGQNNALEKKETKAVEENVLVEDAPAEAVPQQSTPSRRSRRQLDVIAATSAGESLDESVTVEEADAEVDTSTAPVGKSTRSTRSSNIDSKLQSTPSAKTRVGLNRPAIIPGNDSKSKDSKETSKIEETGGARRTTRGRGKIVQPTLQDGEDMDEVSLNDKETNEGTKSFVENEEKISIKEWEAYVENSDLKESDKDVNKGTNTKGDQPAEIDEVNVEGDCKRKDQVKLEPEGAVKEEADQEMKFDRIVTDQEMIGSEAVIKKKADKKMEFDRIMPDQEKIKPKEEKIKSAGENKEEGQEMEFDRIMPDQGKMKSEGGIKEASSQAIIESGAEAYKRNIKEVKENRETTGSDAADINQQKVTGADENGGGLSGFSKMETEELDYEVPDDNGNDSDGVSSLGADELLIFEEDPEYMSLFTDVEVEAVKEKVKSSKTDAQHKEVAVCKEKDTPIRKKIVIRSSSKDKNKLTAEKQENRSSSKDQGRLTRKRQDNRSSSKDQDRLTAKQPENRSGSKDQDKLTGKKQENISSRRDQDRSPHKKHERRSSSKDKSTAKKQENRSSSKDKSTAKKQENRSSSKDKSSHKKQENKSNSKDQDNSSHKKQENRSSRDQDKLSHKKLESKSSSNRGQDKSGHKKPENKSDTHDDKSVQSSSKGNSRIKSTSKPHNDGRGCFHQIVILALPVYREKLKILEKGAVKVIYSEFLDTDSVIDIVKKNIEIYGKNTLWVLISGLYSLIVTKPYLECANCHEPVKSINRTHLPYDNNQADAANSLLSTVQRELGSNGLIAIIPPVPEVVVLVDNNASHEELHRKTSVCKVPSTRKIYDYMKIDFDRFCNIWTTLAIQRMQYWIDAMPFQKYLDESFANNLSMMMFRDRYDSRLKCWYDTAQKFFNLVLQTPFPSKVIADPLNLFEKVVVLGNTYFTKQLQDLTKDMPVVHLDESLSFDKDGLSFLNEQHIKYPSRTLWVVLTGVSQVASLCETLPLCTKSLCNLPLAAFVPKNHEFGDPDCKGMDTKKMINALLKEAFNFAIDSSRHLPDGSALFLAPIIPLHAIWAGLDTCHTHDTLHKMTEQDANVPLFTGSASDWITCTNCLNNKWLARIMENITEHTLPYDLMREYEKKKPPVLTYVDINESRNAWSTLMADLIKHYVGGKKKVDGSSTLNNQEEECKLPPRPSEKFQTQNYEGTSVYGSFPTSDTNYNEPMVPFNQLPVPTIAAAAPPPNPIPYPCPPHLQPSYYQPVLPMPMPAQGPYSVFPQGNTAYDPWHPGWGQGWQNPVHNEVLQSSVPPTTSVPPAALSAPVVSAVPAPINASCTIQAPPKLKATMKGHLAVQNVKTDMDKTQVKTILQEFGEMEDLNWPMTSDNKPGGFIMIRYTHRRHAERAERILNYLKVFGEGAKVKLIGSENHEEDSETKLESGDLELLLNMHNVLDSIRSETNTRNVLKQMASQGQGATIPLSTKSDNVEKPPDIPQISSIRLPLNDNIIKISAAIGNEQPKNLKGPIHLRKCYKEAKQRREILHLKILLAKDSKPGRKDLGLEFFRLFPSDVPSYDEKTDTFSLSYDTRSFPLTHVTPKEPSTLIHDAGTEFSASALVTPTESYHPVPAPRAEVLPHDIMHTIIVKDFTKIVPVKYINEMFKDLGALERGVLIARALHFTFQGDVAALKVLSGLRFPDRKMSIDIKGDGKDIKLSASEIEAAKVKIKVPVSKLMYEIGKAMKEQIDDDVNVYTFKTRLCRYADGCKLKALCHGYHSKVDRRRCPMLFKYSNEMCPEMESSGSCYDNDACSKAHSPLEVLFHFYNYKCKMCPGWDSKGICDKLGRVCASAHPETPDIFYNDAWQNLYVEGLQKTLDFLASAIKNLCIVADLQCLRVLLVTPSPEMAKLYVGCMKDLAKSCNQKVTELTGKIITEGTTVLIATVDSVLPLLHKCKVLQSGKNDLGRLKALILDDGPAIFNSLSQSKKSLFKIFGWKGVNTVVTAENITSEGVAEAFQNIRAQGGFKKVYGESRRHKDKAETSSTPSSLSSYVEDLSSESKSSSKRSKDAYTSSSSRSSDRNRYKSKVESEHKSKDESDHKAKVDSEHKAKVASEYKSKIESEYKKAKRAFEQEHERELELFTQTPEVHPDYEQKYSVFIEQYQQQFAGRDDMTHCDKLWESFWKELITVTLKEEYDGKQEILDKEYLVKLKTFDKDYSEKQERKPREARKRKSPIDERSSRKDKYCKDERASNSIESGRYQSRESQKRNSPANERQRESQKRKSSPNERHRESQKRKSSPNERHRESQKRKSPIDERHREAQKYKLPRDERPGQMDEYHKGERIPYFNQGESSTNYRKEEKKPNLNLGRSSMEYRKDDKAPYFNRGRSNEHRKDEKKPYFNQKEMMQTPDESGEDFSLEDILRLLTEVSPALGILEPALMLLLKEMINCGPNETKICKLFESEDNQLILKKTSEKTKTLSTVTGSGTHALALRLASVQALNLLTRFTSSSKKRSHFGLDIERIAKTTYNKEPASIIEFIKNELASRYANASDNEITDIYVAVTSAQFNIAYNVPEPAENFPQKNKGKPLEEYESKQEERIGLELYTGSKYRHPDVPAQERPFGFKESLGRGHGPLSHSIDYGHSSQSHDYSRGYSSQSNVRPDLGKDYGHGHSSEGNDYDHGHSSRRGHGDYSRYSRDYGPSSDQSQDELIRNTGSVSEDDIKSGDYLQSTKSFSGLGKWNTFRKEPAMQNSSNDKGGTSIMEFLSQF